MSIVRSIFNFFFLLFLKVTLTAKLYFPELNHKFTLLKNVTSNFTNMVKYEVYGINAFQVYEDGIMLHTSFSDTNPYQRVYFNNSSTESSYNDERLIDFGFEGSTLHFLVESQKIHSYSIFQNKQISITDASELSIYNNSQVQATNESFYLINPGNQNQSAIFYKVFRKQQIKNLTKIEVNAQKYGINASATPFDFETMEVFTNITGDTIKARVCKKYYAFNEYLVLWNQSSYMEVWTCDFWQCSMIWNVENDLQNSSWSTGDINWGYDCNKLYVEFDEYEKAASYNLSGYRLSNYTINEPIYDFKPAGIYGYEGTILFMNGSLHFISLTNNSFLKEYKDFGQVTQQSRYVWGANRKLFLNYEDSVDVLKFECWNMTYYSYERGMCADCSWTCASCNQNNGVCIDCIQNYVHNKSNAWQCIPKQTDNQITEEIVSNSSDFFNGSDSQVLIDEIDQETQTPFNDKRLGALFNYQQAVAQMALDGFSTIGPAIEVSFLILSMTPLAWLFLNFMNFWNICSFYLFLNASMTQYLKIILKIIYDRINTPLFDLSDLSQQIYPFQEKLPNSKQEYGISSSFLATNLQSFISFLSCALLVGFAVMLLKYRPNDSWIKKKFEKQIDFKEILANQYISIASNFFLPFSLFLNKLNSTSFHQKPNLLLHILFIGMSLIFPFFVFGKNYKLKTIKSSSLPQKENFRLSSSDKDIQSKKIEWMYFSNCNTLIPFLCVLGIPEIFYCAGFGFFLFGVWMVWKVGGFKINELILSLYPLLFHLSFTVGAVMGKQSLLVKHYGSMICAFILFLGAIHELLSMFLKAIVFFIKQIYNSCNKRSNKVKEQELNPSQNSNHENNLRSKTSNVKLDLLKSIKLSVQKKGKIRIRKKKVHTTLDVYDNQSTKSNIQTNKGTILFKQENKIGITQINQKFTFDCSKQLEAHPQIIKSDDFLSAKTAENKNQTLNEAYLRQQILLDHGIIHKKIKIHKTKELKEGKIIDIIHKTDKHKF